MSTFHLSTDTTKKRKKYGMQKAATNVFGAGDESSSDDNDGKHHVNHELLKEQKALRQRANAAAMSYDFDGTYNDASSAVVTEKVKDTKPRYITDLLEQAKRRKQERELVHERKVARELAEEDADYSGKDKFITSAYKQKLKERETWAQQDKQQDELERNEDVTKQSGLGNFYSNLNQNVALGGHRERVNEEPTGREKGSLPSVTVVDAHDTQLPGGDEAQEPHWTKPPDSSTKTIHQIREDKVAMARSRYLQRRGMTPEEAAAERLQ